MNNVIKIDFSKPVKLNGTEKVSLRAIHSELGVGRDFTNWAKESLELFEQDQDFGVLASFGENPLGGRPKQEYWVTVDTAKHIGMLSRSEAGKRIRTYFIECEKLVYANDLDHKLTSIPTVVNPDFLRLMADTLERETARADAAERTKAQISDNKTATAVGRVGGLVTANKKLKEDLSKVRQLQGRWTARALIEAYPEQFKGVHAGSISHKLKKVAEVNQLPIEKQATKVMTVYNKEITSSENTYCQQTVDLFMERELSR